jgi:hypothetical protein
MEKLNCGLITLEQPGGDLIAPIVEGLEGNNCKVEVLFAKKDWRPENFDFMLAYGPMQSMTKVIARLAEFPHSPPLACWYTEQVPSPQPSSAVYYASRLRYLYDSYVHSNKAPWLNKRIPHAQLLQRAGRLRALGELLTLQAQHQLKLVCAFTETNAKFLKHYGLPVVDIPMGYHPNFGERLSDESRDIDVVFLGSTRDKRRKALIAELQEQLARRRIHFVIKDGSQQHGNVFGRERILLLNRTKIMLSIMRQPWDDPVFRMLLAAPNGAMLLSENLLPTSTGPFLPGMHFAMTSLSDMADSIQYYLSHEQERQAIADQAYNFVTGELTMTNMAHRLMCAMGYDPFTNLLA